MESKYSQLTSQTLSHELMTPLNSITNLSDISLRTIEDMISSKKDIAKLELDELREYI